MASQREAWLSLLPSDPRPSLLSSDEPFARFATMTDVLGKPEDDAEVRSVRQAVVADPRVRALIERLPSWESAFAFGGHASPAFPPNILRLLHGLGVRAGDFPAIERMLDRMLRHQADDGRCLTPGGPAGKPPSAWGALPCDHFAILEALAPYPAVGKGKTASAEDGTSTAEIVEALAATFGADGMVTPRSCCKGFEAYSFGRRTKSSPWATARVSGLLCAFSSVLVAGSR